MLFEFGRDNAIRVRGLREAYMDAGGPSRVRGPGDFDADRAARPHRRAGCHLWLAAETDDHRARAAAIVEEFVTDALTRGVIADLLDAIGAS